jgi:5-methylcytosine-specific restriction protein A
MSAQKAVRAGSTTRNPTWTRDELILALDLYFRINPLHTNKENPEIRGLSELLNALPIHRGSVKGGNFRNSTGVYMELCNFLRFDPNYSGKGLRRGAKLQEEVWSEFAADLPRLRRTAEAIKQNYQSALLSGEEDRGEAEDEEYPEGKILFKLHRVRERNATLIKKKKQRALEKTGRLACEVCGFDFNRVYGALGYGFAECHHVLPISSLPPEYQTKLSDLAIVCANCHRMLHKGRECLSIVDLQQVIQQSSSKVC